MKQDCGISQEAFQMIPNSWYLFKKTPALSMQILANTTHYAAGIDNVT